MIVIFDKNSILITLCNLHKVLAQQIPVTSVWQETFVKSTLTTTWMMLATQELFRCSVCHWIRSLSDGQVAIASFYEDDDGTSVDVGSGSAASVNPSAAPGRPPKDSGGQARSQGSSRSVSTSCDPRHD